MNDSLTTNCCCLFGIVTEVTDTARCACRNFLALALLLIAERCVQPSSSITTIHFIRRSFYRYLSLPQLMILMMLCNHFVDWRLANKGVLNALYRCAASCRCGAYLPPHDFDKLHNLLTGI